MRPNGLDSTFSLVRYSRAQDGIHEAVESAIDEGMTVADFLRNVEESWEIVLDEKKECDLQAFKEAS